eukprot:gnl/MRDRNA2_/MRDRNA2_63608_c0_seq1.p1 gnl/MRDRNA2_/MRDRNA2_63608_c0~~gnl/MRDRNA2_/MRDRNA2_63608_c0_seq1.p1  ORF type:complete len:230 (-),score=32.33 gnl/MRDRNA2_/MRDRNA2_63608_c0_seq1:15-704(-)
MPRLHDALLLAVSVHEVASALIRLRHRHGADPFDCYSEIGVDYVGLQSTTASGRVCKNWIEQGEYDGTVKGIGNHNFCRNPQGSKDKPWCFTVDPSKEWEYCIIKECAEDVIPEKWTAPKGSKSEDAETKGPCEHEPPKETGYTQRRDMIDRSCMSNRGEKWWLVGREKIEASDTDDCLVKCKAMPGAEYFTFFEKKDDDGMNCGCYRECILVDKKLTINEPQSYRITI